MSPDFDSMPLSPALQQVVKELGFEHPTPIQIESIPVLLNGKDLIGQSKTGSGKTAAFALPILHHLNLQTRDFQALVVCPTRELSAQVAREFRKFGRQHKDLQVLVVAGGQAIRPQASALRRGVHVVVGTPGRLLDHIQRGNLPTQAVKTVVLDEADRMLDMGFLADMERILESLPKPRQTALFSATFPSSIESLSSAHQDQPVRVTIEEPEQLTDAHRQYVLSVDPERKHQALSWTLAEFAHESVLIFCNYKAAVAELTDKLAAARFSVDCLHGDMEQFFRDQVMTRFRNQSIRILVATDVAARGIDVEDLDMVINYEMPAQPEIYVHRIGRTARAGKAGVAVAFATSADTRRLEAVEALVGHGIERLPSLPAGEPLWRPRAAAMATILISGGRKDKVRPGDILGALTGDAGNLSSADIGKIEIHDRLSYVAVAEKVSRQATKSLNDGRIKGRRFRASLIR